MKNHLLLFSLLFFSASAVYAQAATITSQQIPQKTSFAQPFDVRFELSHTPGYVLELDKENLPQDFTLLQEQKQTPSPDTTVYDLTFMPFTLGVSTFSAVTFNLQSKDSTSVGEQILSTPTEITVEPVHYFDDQTIRDIRPPYIPTNPWLWLLAVLAILLIIGISWFLSRKSASRQYRSGRQKTEDKRPADIIAFSKIEALLQSGLWEQAQYKLFYSELEEILREYFWRRFHMDVSADTSAELLSRARRIPALAPSLALLRQYLVSTDLVKFAKIAPDQEIMQRDVSAVRQIIRDTTPKLPLQTKEEH